MENKDQKIETFKRSLKSYVDAVGTEKAATSHYNPDDSCAGISEGMVVFHTNKDLDDAIDDLFEDF